MANGDRNGSKDVWKWVAGALVAILIGLSGAVLDRALIGSEINEVQRTVIELEGRIALLEREHDQEWGDLERALLRIDTALSEMARRGRERSRREE